MAWGEFTKRQNRVHKRQTLLTSRFHLGQAPRSLQPSSPKQYLNFHHHTPVVEKTPVICLLVSSQTFSCCRTAVVPHSSSNGKLVCGAHVNICGAHVNVLRLRFPFGSLCLTPSDLATELGGLLCQSRLTTQTPSWSEESGGRALQTLGSRNVKEHRTLRCGNTTVFFPLLFRIER